MKIFDRLRATHLRRTPDGILGGVCAGLAHRWAFNPIIVRMAAILFMIFGGPVFLIYGVIWLIVPVFPSNRIVLEDSARGVVSAHLAGAIASLILGVWSLQWTLDLMINSGLIFPALFVLVTVGCLTFFLRRRVRHLSSNPISGGTDDADADSGEKLESPNTPDTLTQQATFATRELPMATEPAPRAPKPPAISSRYLMGALAVTMIGVGIALLVSHLTIGGILLSVGVGVLAIGGAIAVAGARGRRATWLTFLAWLTAPPLALITGLCTLVPTPLLNERDLDTVLAGSEDFSVGNTPTTAFIDSRDFSTEALNRDVSLMSVGSSTTFSVPTDDAVIFTIKGTGSVFTYSFGGWQATQSGRDIPTMPGMIFDNYGQALNPETPITTPLAELNYQPSTLVTTLTNDAVTIASPAAIADPSSAIHLTIDFGFGDVTIDEQPPQGVSGVEYAAKKAGYVLEPRPTSTEPATDPKGEN